MAKKKETLEGSENPLWDYDSHSLLKAVDLLDDVRPVISDDGYNPPKIRIDLLKLHGLVMEMKNTGNLTPDGRKRFSRIMALAGDLEMEISGCIDNLEKVSDMLGDLLTLGRDVECPDPDPEEDPEDLEEPE